MKLIHQCYFEGSELIINVDFKNFDLQIDFEPDEGAQPPEGIIVGTHPCKSFDELNKVYQDIAQKLFKDEKCYDEYDQVEEAIDLRLLHEINIKENEYPQYSWALYILEKILPKIKEKKLDNLAFYWGDEGAEGVFINNKDINGISEKELISVTQDEDWLNGISVGIRIEGEQLVDDYYELMDDLGELMYQINDQMYETCAILEDQKCFGLIETADDFRALNVWHDYYPVNIELRKKWKSKVEE